MKEVMATPKTGSSRSVFFSTQYGLRFAVNLKIANLHSQFYQVLSGRIHFDPKIHIFLYVPCVLEFKFHRAIKYTFIAMFGNKFIFSMYSIYLKC